MKKIFKKSIFYALVILVVLFLKLKSSKNEIGPISKYKTITSHELVGNSANHKNEKSFSHPVEHFKNGASLSMKNPESKLIDKNSKINFLSDDDKQSSNINEEKGGDFRDADESNEQDGPDKAFEQDFYRTMNLEMQRPTPEVLPAIITQNKLQIQQQAAIKSFAIPGASFSSAWIELGPNNVGGRTRALTFDPNDTSGKKVWAGGVSGGLWYNNDITSTSSAWNKVDDFWQSLSVTKIVFDTLDKKVAYVTTGEGFGVGSSIGAGIWKTSNGGSTWTQLSSTTNFLYSNDIIIRNESGKSVLYAAIDANNYMGKWTNTSNVGLYRSADNGTTWTQTLPIIDSVNTNKVPFVAASTQVSKNNTIWVGTKASPNANTNRGGGYILKSTNGIDWTVVKKFTVTNGSGRVTVAVAPSNEKIIYAFVENDNKLENLYRSNDEGITWTTLTKPVDADNTMPTTDFTKGQAWYDQSLAVDPNNPNVAIVGGIDLFKTVNGGNTWTQIGKWSNNNKLSLLKCSNVHADQHVVTYKPGSSNIALFGNDGGVFYTSNILGSDSLDVISTRNNGYNVTQFYSGAIHPYIGKNFFLAGAQDNGSQKFLSANPSATTRVSGGDGSFCFIDQTNPKYQITSYVNNVYYLSTDTGVSFNKTILDTSIGSFINPATYDNVLHILYSNSSSNFLVRIKNITGTPKVEYVNVPNLTNGVTALKVSPYNHLSTTLFLGTSNGKLLKVINADSVPTSTLIGGANFPSGSISCIEIGKSENELIVTFFNYGSKKIWYTSDGGKTWIDKGINFPDIPVRWALFNPNSIPSQVMLATELGIYSTNNFETSAPIWTQANNGFANVRTDMLQMRSSDYAVIAATYGRGLFLSNAFSEAKPPLINSFSPKIGIKGTKITIKGSNFINASEVRFGGLPALSFTVDADTVITAIVDIAYPGYVNVKTTGGVASLAGFSTSTPKISSFLPTSGGNGIPIIISGSNLTDITMVMIGGKAVKNFTIESSTTISTTIPDSTVNGKVVVSNDFYADSLAGFTTCITPKLSKTIDTSFCDGNILQISSTASSFYQWLNSNKNITNGTGQTYNIAATGSYQVKTTSNGCSALSNPLNVIVNALPTAPIVRDTFYCQNSKLTDTFRVVYTAGNSLLWYNIDTVGASSSSIMPKPNTTTLGFQKFFVSQKNTTTGCEGSKSKINVEIRPTPATPVISSDTANNLVSNVALKTIWNKDGSALIDTLQKYKPTTPGSYTARSTALGCVSEVSNTYYFIVTGIINLSQNEFVKLTPNPFVNQLNFDFVINGYQKLNIEAFDITTGIKVASLPNILPGMPIYLGQLAAGTYLIRVSSNDLKVVQQFKMVKL
jgi:hypothetical protein